VKVKKEEPMSARNSVVQGKKPFFSSKWYCNIILYTVINFLKNTQCNVQIVLKMKL
jgi:hypothetical protein